MTLQFEPEMYLDDAGNPAGYDVELLNLLATDLGVELKIENQEFDALVPGLLAGNWDMISVGLVPRPPRLLQMYFTDSYVPYEQVLVAAADTDRDATIAALQHRRHHDHRAAGLDGGRAGDHPVPRRHAGRVPAAGRGVPRGGVRARRRHRRRELSRRALHPANPDQLAIVGLDARCRSSTAPGPSRSGDDMFLDYLNRWLQYYKNNGTLDSHLRRGVRLGSERQHLGAGDHSSAR